MKEFFDYAQQIAKLQRCDGLIIDDTTQATEDLKTEGYYNLINGYSPIFKNGKRYYPQTKFEHVKTLYLFDKNLRGIVYKYIASIECRLKALMAHEFSREHGVDETKYLLPQSFAQNERTKKELLRLLNECRNTIKEACVKNSNKYREYIAHSAEKHGHVPFWILIRALSFGTTSIFYKFMQEQERAAIAREFNVSSGQLANMLEVVVSFRNIVAHGERTFCARLPKTRLTTKLDITRKLCIAKNDKGENKFGRNDFLALLICCKYLLPSLEFAGLISELQISLDDLTKRQQPAVMGRIKTAMGLKADSWKLLPKLRIENPNESPDTKR